MIKNQPSKFSFLRKSQKGFSLTEILVAIGVSGIVALGTAQIIVQSSKTGSDSEKLFWLSARRLELQSLVKSPDGWNAIVDATPSLKCLDPGGSCATFTSAQPLNIPINSSTTLNGSSATLGMTNRGDFCDTFNATNTNLDCPVSVKLSWQALCDDASCLHAQPKIKIQFASKEIAKATENLKSYDVEIFRDPKLETLSEVCSSMGGTLDPATRECKVPQLAGGCPASLPFVTGFDATGKAVCEKAPVPGSCSSSDVAIGFTTTGDIACAPACDSP